MGEVFPMTGGRRNGGAGGFNVPGMTMRQMRDTRDLSAAVARRPVGEPTREEEMQALVATEAPRVPWDVFYKQFTWNQGEHVSLIGPTGAGKTSLLISLLPLRSFVAVTATKPRDPTMDALIASGYQRFERWENVPAPKVPRRVIWPNARSIDSDAVQKKVFRDMYARIYREGGWALVIDEGFIMGASETNGGLGLAREMRQVWTQGRSLGISQVVATQRPAWVPLEMYDQATHLFFWQVNDNRALERLGEINRRSSALVKHIIQNLERFQVLYVNTRSGQMFRTKAPRPGFDTVGGG